jgi:hypothetical protein
MIPRLVHRTWAKVNGYFWLPCPICGRMFGGHEVAHKMTASLIDEDGTETIVCPDPLCNYDAGVRNAIAAGKPYRLFFYHAWKPDAVSHKNS